MRIDPSWKDVFLDRLGKWPHVQAAAAAAGVSRGLAYITRRDDPEFAAAWEAAVEQSRRRRYRHRLRLTDAITPQEEVLPRMVVAAVGNINLAPMWSLSAQEKTLYVITEDWRNLSKVGVAADYKKRVGSIQSNLPQLITLRAAFRTRRGRALEQFVHAHFATKRERGEWFALTDDDIAHIARVHRIFCEADGDPVVSWVAPFRKRG